MSMDNFFVNGAIPVTRIPDIIKEIKLNSQIGAHCMFLGQIREDKKNSGQVKSIIYSAHELLCPSILKDIIMEAKTKFAILDVIANHSLGEVKVGELCLFVLITSAHRAACQEAMDYVVEAIKKRLPIFGKEVIENGDYQWKINTEKMKTN